MLPFHDTLEDPDRPGRMREEWTSDGDHPSIEGYRTARRARLQAARLERVDVAVGGALDPVGERQL